MKWKNKKGGFITALLAPLAASVVEPLICSVIKGITGRGVRNTGKRYLDKNF